MEFEMQYICPKCAGPLRAEEGRAVCEKGHSFDRARQGYYNLLLSSSGGVHGDNRDMVEARRRFLDGGFYLPLRTRLAELALDYTPCGGRLLDAGCGEGYYTAEVERLLYERDSTSWVLAFDISKEAVRHTTTRAKRLYTAVASSYAMPIADDSIDTVINVFSPLALDEVGRVLRCGGHFIMVYPDVDHLFGLKKAIYDIPYRNKPQDTAIDGMTLVLESRVEYDITLDKKEDIKALFGMTPYAYRTSSEGRARVESLESLTTEIRFIIAVYEKNRK